MCVKQIITGTAASLTLAASAYSQTVIVANAFDVPGPTSVTADTGLVALGATNTAQLGGAWDTTVTIPVGLVYSQTASMPGDGTFSISSTGVAGLLSNTTATRVFGGTTLSSSETYELTISVAQTSMVGLLDSATIEIGYFDGVDYNPVQLNQSGGGLLGLVDLLTLFGSGNTATIQFTPDTDFGGDDLYIRLSSDSAVTALSGGVTYTGLSLTQIPEPSVAGMSMLGGAVLLLRRRRKQ